MTLRHCLSPQDFIYNFKVISNELWLRRKKGKIIIFRGVPFPLSNIHTQAYMLQMGKKMFEIEADSNYSGWNRARILVIGFSLFPPEFLFLFPSVIFPQPSGGWVGCWLADGWQTEIVWEQVFLGYVH